MNHNDIRHKLSAYIDSAISDKEKAEIEAHLKGCRACSDALDELRKVVEQVRLVEEIDPPAWMTQKIMARVRAEADVKKSWYQRLFFPLAIKLPLEAVGVLFLVVTAYYLSQNINPTRRYAQAPAVIASKKDVLSTDKLKEERKGEAPAPQAKADGQESTYKSLDRKYEHEKPAPPAPVAQPAPAAPAQTPRELGAAPESKELHLVAPEAAASKAEPAPEFSLKKAKPASPAVQGIGGLAADETVKIRFTLAVNDIAAAEQEIEHSIRELKGAAIRRDARASAERLIVSLDSTKLGTFKERLGKLGELKEEKAASASYEGVLHIEIAISRVTRP